MVQNKTGSNSDRLVRLARAGVTRAEVQRLHYEMRILPNCASEPRPQGALQSRDRQGALQGRDRKERYRAAAARSVTEPRPQGALQSRDRKERYRAATVRERSRAGPRGHPVGSVRQVYFLTVP